MYNSLSEIKLVHVGNSARRENLTNLGGIILNAFEGTIKDYRIVQYDPPYFEKIKTSLLTHALDQEIGGHILAITKADLLEENAGDIFNSMFGGKNTKNNVAVVSTTRLFAEDLSLLFARIIKVSLHEIGHNFYLPHYYSYKHKVSGDLLCPMTHGYSNRFGEVGYLKAVIDARGFKFCTECKNSMRVHQT